MSYCRVSKQGREALLEIAAHWNLALYTEHSSPTREERRAVPHPDPEAYRWILYPQPQGNPPLDDLGEAEQALQLGRGIQGRWLGLRHSSAPELEDVLAMLALRAWGQLPAGEEERNRLDELIGIADLTTLSGLVLSGHLEIKEELT